MPFRIIFFYSFFFLTSLCVLSQGTWVQKTSLPDSFRFSSVAFEIANKGYIGTGSADPSLSCLSSFWEYDPSKDAWTQKANFGGGKRGNACGFSIGTKGYLGTGVVSSTSLSPIFKDDFWEYDPILNTWTQKASFGGGPRAQMVGFSIMGKGYAGTGIFDSTFTPSQDFWEYDPVANAWIQKGNYPGGPRADISAAVFVIQNKAYCGTGVDLYQCYNDFWEFNPILNLWTQKANFPGDARGGATGFAVCNFGYLGFGDCLPKFHNDLWLYDPATNSWHPESPLPVDQVPIPGTRFEQSSFVVNNKAYLFGYSNDGYQTYSDLWEFNCDPSPCIKMDEFIYVPNAFSPNNDGENDTLLIFGNECIDSLSFNIYNRWGNKVFESEDYRIGWDGTYKGKAEDPSVFVYSLKVILKSGEKIKKRGNISLIR